MHPRLMDGAEVERVEVCRQKVENNLKLKDTEAALVTPSSLFLMVIGLFCVSTAYGEWIRVPPALYNFVQIYMHICAYSPYINVKAGKKGGY